MAADVYDIENNKKVFTFDVSLMSLLALAYLKTTGYPSMRPGTL